MAKCILPYSDCPFLKGKSECQKIATRPYEKGAKCLRVSSKKVMISRSVGRGSDYLYYPLRVQAWRTNLQNPQLSVYVGSKKVATLELKENCWFLVNEDENQKPMANNELDAVNASLVALGYKKTNSETE